MSTHRIRRPDSSATLVDSVTGLHHFKTQHLQVAFPGLVAVQGPVLGLAHCLAQRGFRRLMQCLGQGTGAGKQKALYQLGGNALNAGLFKQIRRGDRLIAPAHPYQGLVTYQLLVSGAENRLVHRFEFVMFKKAGSDAGLTVATLGQLQYAFHGQEPYTAHQWALPGRRGTLR